MIVETLRVFVTVAEQSNFSRAAEILNLSQPGVSLHIRNLENEFGAKLLHRSPKHVKLTEAGEILYRQAKQILTLYHEAKQEIQSLRDEVTGLLKIGASFTIGEYILPRVLAQYVEQYPQVEIQVNIGNTEEIVQAVRTNELDLGLVEGEVTQPGLHIKSFMKDEMILIASPSHPLCNPRAAKLESALQGQIWIFREGGSGTRAFSDRFIRDAGLEVKRSFVFSSTQGVKEAVASGLGIAILSRLVVRKELRSGELCEFPIKGYRFIRNLFMIQEKGESASMALNMFTQKLLASPESTLS
ncbi:MULTISPECIES: LysR substrate-binding domain-containing protein [unclassified Paenibacillus]|uniref:LysR substrate-binding domain-containing protein n=1 Tax=unclassified Paenibacillus TaxID=185978 RepID=UPI001AE8E283|nr:MULTISPECIES: LysR substrate-binding domain-containing protein [unclassified Paenibacillus]MBP1156645.1 DNA-binding transcriptional LysR family regulator [Paenibacillus sp. PvP091]MBP1172617.1 DNA-binding transcriptional LysR family regulator [Paenibacillus sp. PvR098]MBP2438997.1 DNA-binding transcriptional LysR family regulator [Paenibacillus sp. PvP052]